MCAGQSKKHHMMSCACRSIFRSGSVLICHQIWLWKSAQPLYLVNDWNSDYNRFELWLAGALIDIADRLWGGSAFVSGEQCLGGLTCLCCPCVAAPPQRLCQVSWNSTLSHTSRPMLTRVAEYTGRFATKGRPWRFNEHFDRSRYAINQIAGAARL